MKGEQHNYAIYYNDKMIWSKNSHSAAYAFIAYQTAWLKKYYPIEFMCNLLTSEINNNDKNEKLNIYIRAAERLRIICMPPDINKSGLGFKIEIGHHEKFNKDMEVLSGVGTKAVDDIVLNQPYKDLEDFVRRTNARVVNTKVFATLVNSGGMDCWKVDREELLGRYDVIKEKLEKEKKLKAKQEKKKQEFGGQTIFDDGEFDYSGEKLNL
jgi:DNA polymerase-3 subunit alpha